MVPSPKVATYDLQPTMNAAGVAKSVSYVLQNMILLNNKLFNEINKSAKITNYDPIRDYELQI